MRRFVVIRQHNRDFFERFDGQLAACKTLASWRLEKSTFQSVTRVQRGGPTARWMVGLRRILRQSGGRGGRGLTGAGRLGPRWAVGRELKKLVFRPLVRVPLISLDQ